MRIRIRRQRHIQIQMHMHVHMRIHIQNIHDVVFGGTSEVPDSCRHPTRPGCQVSLPGGRRPGSEAEVVFLSSSLGVSILATSNNGKHGALFRVDMGFLMGLYCGPYKLESFIGSSSSVFQLQSLGLENPTENQASLRTHHAVSRLLQESLMKLEWSMRHCCQK